MNNKLIRNKKYNSVADATNWWTVNLMERYKNLRQSDIHRFIKYSGEMDISNVEKFHETLQELIRQDLKKYGRVSLFSVGKPEGLLKISAEQSGMEALTSLASGVFPNGYMIVENESVKFLDVRGNETVFSSKKDHVEKRREKSKNHNI